MSLYYVKLNSLLNYVHFWSGECYLTGYILAVSTDWDRRHCTFQELAASRGRPTYDHLVPDNSYAGFFV
jgi:hypothetical protein